MTDTHDLVYPPGPADSEQRRTFVAFRRDTLKFFCDLHDHYGEIVYFRLGDYRHYSVRAPEIIREVLVDKNHLMRRTDVTWDTLGRFLGNGLLVSHGETHRQRRALIQPIFTPGWVNTYCEDMQQCVEDITQFWVPGETRNIADDGIRLTLQIVCRTLFGSVSSLDFEDIRRAISTIQIYAEQRMQQGTARLAEDEVNAASSTLNRVVDTLIASHRSSETTKDLLSLLIGAIGENGQNLNDTQLREEVVTLFMAGQETTSNALAWACLLLAQYPQVLGRLTDVIDRITRGEPVTLDHIARMPYLDRVIRETLRLYPPGWIIGRTPVESVKIGGYLIQPKDTINICIYAVHHNAAIFENPGAFEPDRFARDYPRYTYMPFGAGSHICIGQPFAMLEIAVSLTTILQNWTMQLPPDQPVRPEPMVTLRPSPGVNLILNRRAK